VTGPDATTLELPTRAAGRWTLVLCAGVVLLGVCLRFTGLDRKVYWYDETFTSLEISGYLPREVAAGVLTGRVVSGSDLERFQFPRADSSKTTLDTIRGLIANEPQLAPAYFVVLRWWSDLRPDSIGAIRALSALFSVLALALAFWLCRELFPASPRVAYLCVALMAVSPLQLLYAQEARPYSMWIAAVLLSGTLLLRALRRPRVTAWALYALSAALSLYTFLFSALVLLSQGAFVLIESRFRITTAVKSFLLSVLVAGAAFLAWPYRGQHSGAGNDHYPLLQYATKWLRSVGVLFADFNVRPHAPPTILLPYALLLLALLALSGYAVVFVYRRATRLQAAFVLTLIGSLCLPLLALDALSGSSVALVTRYSLPSLVGLQIALAYTLAARTAAVGTARTRLAWQGLAAVLLGLGALSCVTVVRAAEWWNKDPQNYVHAAARAINAAPQPALVLSDAWFIPILSLEHSLRPEVRYQLTVEPGVPDIDQHAASLFVLQPSPHLRSELQREFQFQLVDPAADLWRLTQRADAPPRERR
jgi:uncharacterized membrane protein